MCESLRNTEPWLLRGTSEFRPFTSGATVLVGDAGAHPSSIAGESVFSISSIGIAQ